MGENRVVPGRVAQYFGDELVVGRLQTQLVREKLEEWQAAPTQKDDSPALGLTLLGLNAKQAVQHLRENDPKKVVEASDGIRLDRIPVASDLDVLHRCLRLHFRETYSGWVPTFGKNRILELVEGAYVIDLTRVPDGKPADLLAPSRRPALDVVDGPVNLPRRRADRGSGGRVGLVDTKLIPDPWLLGAFETDAADIWGEGDDLTAPATHHATFIAGLILQQASGAHIVHRAALDNVANADSWAVAKEIATLARSGLDVLNLSLGCATDDGQPALVLEAALRTLAPETLVVASAGNRGDAPDGTAPAPTYPAAIENVVAVGALKDGRELADFSPDEPWVDAYAKGVDVLSTYGGPVDASALAQWAGTSFSAAIVSGAIAAGISRASVRRTPGPSCANRPARLSTTGPSSKTVCRLTGRPLVLGHASGAGAPRTG